MWVYLFDGGDLSKSLFRLFLITPEEGSDLIIHSLAHAFVLELLPARQNNNHNNNPLQLLTNVTSVTLLLLFRPSAIKRPPASVNMFSICITRRHTQYHLPISGHIPIFTCSMSFPSPPHMPLLTKSIFFRRLNRPRLAHSG